MMSEPAPTDWLEGAMIVSKAVERMPTKGVVLGSVANQVVGRKDGAHERYRERREEMRYLRDEYYGSEEEEDESSEEEDHLEESVEENRESAPMQAHIALQMAGDMLKLAIDPQPFCCGGSVSVNEESKEEKPRGKIITHVKEVPVLQVRTGADAEWVDAGTVLNPDMAILQRIAKPAVFGDLKTQTTKFDESVRKALDLPPDCWRCVSTITKTTKPAPPEFYGGYYYYTSKSGGTLKTATLQVPKKDVVEVSHELLHDNKNIIGKIAQDIGVLFKQRVKLIPHKMNIYAEGGFFRAHVDTPIHKNMIGTVVIALPVPHQGGELEITHGETVHKAQLSPDSADDKLRWVAFYSDCKHEVKPVMEGHRVTMTFTILHSSGNIHPFASEESYAGPVDPGSVIDHVNKLPSFLSDMDKAQVKVGILLSRKYTLAGLQPEGLKGLDKQIYEALKTRFECTLKSVVVTTYYSAYPGDYTRTKFKINVYDFDRNEILRLLDKSTEPAAPAQDRKFFDLAGGTVLKCQHHEGAEHTGNEAMAETIEATYLSAALLLN